MIGVYDHILSAQLTKGRLWLRICVCVCVFVNCLLLIRAHLSRDERSNLSGRRQIRATSWPFSPWLDFSYPNLSGYVVHQYSDKNIVNTCTVKHELKNNICKLEFLQLCSSANQ